MADSITVSIQGVFKNKVGFFFFFLFRINSVQ